MKINIQPIYQPFKKIQLSYFKNSTLYFKMIFHNSNFSFGSNKRQIAWSSSCVGSKEGCQLGSRSQEPKPKFSYFNSANQIPLQH